MTTMKCKCGWSVTKPTPGRARMALTAHQTHGCEKDKHPHKRRKPNKRSQQSPGADLGAHYCPNCGFAIAALNRAVALVSRFSK